MCIRDRLILGQLGQDFRLQVALSQLLLHILHHIRDALVARVLIERLKQIQLRVLLDLHAQVIKLLDRSVAGQEV